MIHTKNSGNVSERWKTRERKRMPADLHRSDPSEFFRSAELISIRSFPIKTAIYFTHDADSNSNNNNISANDVYAWVHSFVSGDTSDTTAMATAETNKSIKLTWVRYPYFFGRTLARTHARTPNQFGRLMCGTDADTIQNGARTCGTACNLQFVAPNHYLFFHSIYISWIRWPWHIVLVPNRQQIRSRRRGYTNLNRLNAFIRSLDLWIALSDRN